MKGLAESPPQALGAIGKDAFHVGPHYEFVQEPIERNSVPDMVAHERACISQFEIVLVDPEPVRTSNLFIHKPRRLPRGDPAPPSNVKTSNAQPVIKQCSYPRLDRSRRNYPEIQPRWRD